MYKEQDVSWHCDILFYFRNTSMIQVWWRNPRPLVRGWWGQDEATIFKFPLLSSLIHMQKMIRIEMQDAQVIIKFNITIATNMYSINRIFIYFFKFLNFLLGILMHKRYNYNIENWVWLCWRVSGWGLNSCPSVLAAFNCIYCIFTGAWPPRLAFPSRLAIMQPQKSFCQGVETLPSPTIPQF